MGGRKAFEKCGGFLRGHVSRGREGNVERGCGFGCVEDGGICIYNMGLISGIECTSKWVLDENGDVYVRW